MSCRSLLLLMLLLIYRTVAFAGSSTTPDYDRKHQADAGTSTQVTLTAATSTAVAAADGDRRALTICCGGANDCVCGFTTPATTSTGILLKANWLGCWTNDDSAKQAHYCISTAGSSVGVFAYK